MRIVQVANFVHNTSGGVRITTEELGARYAAAGHDVMWLRPGASHHMARDERGRVVVELPGAPLPASNGYRMFVRRAPVGALVASWRPDVVEVHDTTTLTWLGCFGRRLGATTVMFAHERLGLVLGDHLGAGSAMRRAASWHHRRAVDGFDHVIAPSRYGAREFSGLAPVRVVPFGVDLDLFHPDRRHDIQRPPHPRRVVLVSRLTREKRPVLAVHAINELRWRGTDVELLVAGDGPLHAEVSGAAWASSGVRMLGHIADRRHLGALLADADAVICPGPRETFGLAALEALAAGTPIVCVNVGAVAELLGPGAGTACPPDADALADGLARTLDEDRDAQRRAARARAEEYTWERAAAALLTAYGPRRPTFAR